MAITVHTVLLVDDDDSSRLTLGALLEDDGFRVQTAVSGAEVRRLISGSIDPDLVLLDQHLGDELGSDLLLPIRAGLPRAKIVLMSGSVELATLPNTVDAAFAKGEPYEELSSVLRGLLG
jgi:DNA-binding NtrC family response regulator